MKICIVGAGKLGTKVANALLGGSHSVTVIDKNESTLQNLSSRLDIMTIAGNGKQISILRDIHIASFDFLLACTDRDEKNIVIASFAKKLGCSKVIARVRDPEHVGQADFIRDTMSIDYLVNPDMAITNEIYKYLIEKTTLSNGIFTTEKAAIIEFSVNAMPQLIGLRIHEVRQILPNMLVVSISQNGKIIIPHGDTLVCENNTLYVIGEKDEIISLNSKVRKKGKYNDLEKVMIIGGGKTGLFLAQKLSAFGISTKIVERNLDRCYYLSEHLDDTIVLHGDATDLNLLEEENFDSMNALVTCTGFDEDNLLLALLAKNHGIDNVIAKVSRGIYTDMVSQMGVDMALNPLDITASSILRLIQGRKKILLSEIIQGQAEVIEIVAASHMKLTSMPLSKLHLPDGILIAAIHRNRTLIIPDGNTTIRANDRVIIFCLLSELTDLEKVINTPDGSSLFR